MLHDVPFIIISDRDLVSLVGSDKCFKKIWGSNSNSVQHIIHNLIYN